METNPYQKGTIEYLDWATEQHNKATAPVKKKVATPTAVPAKPKAKDVIGAALEDAESKKAAFSNGLAGMIAGVGK